MKLFDEETLHENKRFLELLSEKFPGIQTTTAEIINLKAILNLPKGTEHFISDIHGEYLAFDHILRNCSGSIRRKINETLGHILSEEEIRELTTIIYYPSEKLKDLKSKQDLSEEWYEKTMKHLITVCKISASKYSHSKIRKTLPPNYAYIIQELLFKSNITETEKIITTKSFTRLSRQGPATTLSSASAAQSEGSISTICISSAIFMTAA